MGVGCIFCVVVSECILVWILVVFKMVTAMTCVFSKRCMSREVFLKRPSKFVWFIAETWKVYKGKKKTFQVCLVHS